MDLYDVTIIGSGPTGLFSAFYSGMRALKTKLIDANANPGGLITYFYPEKTIRDIGGIPEIKGHELVAQLMRQASVFHPEMIQGQTITRMERDREGNFKLFSQNGITHYTRTVILAAGNGVFKPNKLDDPDARNYEGKSLHYAVNDINAFRGKIVAVSGGGNSALDWACELSKISRKVYVVYHGDQFHDIHEYLLQRLKQTSVHVLLSSEIVRLSGSAGQLHSFTLKNKKSGRIQTVPADTLIVSHGFQFDSGNLNQWGLERQQSGIEVDGNMGTKIPGVFAAGNIASYPNKLHLIASCFEEGPRAVNSVRSYLDPQAPSQAMVSTHHPYFLKDF
jgi:thioredoxin reductase (NADPH)